MKIGKVIHPAVAGNQKIAHECNVLPQDQDCNWDPILLEVMNNTKPTKSGAHYCSYEGTGNLTIFFTGNSFALRQLAAVKTALKSMYKKLYYVARPACLTFEFFNIGYEKYWQCDELMNSTAKFLEKIKPDVLMISQKVSGNDQFKGRVNSIEVNDTTVVKLREYFQIWSPFVKKIYHIQPHPTLWVNPATSMARELANGASIERHFLTLGAVESRVGPGWWRIKSAMRSCPKCTPIEMNEAFVEDNKFFYHDRNTKLSYFCDNGHLSPFGANKMIPILRKVISEDFKGTI
uniref:SGNH domain-containing protein n=1 Tax=Panagrolaimus sp. PS1159 TaxID=55785 RepID=A0AC35GM62_9BILA